MTDENHMYTLGMIFRLIWPDGDAPQSIIRVALIKPVSGLGLAIKRPEAKSANQDDLGYLINKIPANLADQKNGMPIGDQGPFWIGYYHYVSAIANAKNYGPEQLASAGQAMFGGQWQTDISRALGLSDARRIRQWMSGDRPIPAGIWADVAALLRARKIAIDSVFNDLVAINKPEKSS